MSEIIQKERLVLASRSPNRQAQLKSLGLRFDVIPSAIDETTFKAQHDGLELRALALLLAKEKAQCETLTDEAGYIISADQICALGTVYFDKPLNKKNAKAQLMQLQGKTHQLHTGVCIAKGGQIVWQHVETTELTMRSLSEALIDHYLEQDKPYEACGSYHYESYGKWLFDSVKGLESNIVGLPLPHLIHALLNLEIIEFPLHEPKPGV